MGQYYTPLLIGNDGKAMIASAHDFDNGIKLMEHSWIGNDFVNAVLSFLYENPMRVAWIGDYATDIGKPFEFGDGFINSFKEFKPYYDMAWTENEVTRIAHDTKPYELDFEHTHGFLVNETKGIYIDLEKYIAANRDRSWCIHPLPILTCIGNGLGGGDFNGAVGGEDVGTWAFDYVSITNLRPCSIREEEYHFSEELPF